MFIKEAKKHHEIGIQTLKKLNKNTTYLETLFNQTLAKGIKHDSD